MLMAGG
ncbi:hypothetical protein YPPY113_3043, partial [Yersinia pestis PY-113]